MFKTYLQVPLSDSVGEFLLNYNILYTIPYFIKLFMPYFVDP